MLDPRRTPWRPPVSASSPTRNGGQHAFILKQECIPVGCVPSATAAVCWGVPAPGGACSWGVPAPGGCLLQGVPARGCLLLGGACCWGCLLLGVVSQHALRQTPPPRQTDRCKNITFASSLRTVNIKENSLIHFSVVFPLLLHEVWYSFLAGISNY